MSDFEERMGRLNPKEATMVVLIGQGKTNKEIATELNLSEHTIKKHYMSKIYAVLGIRTEQRGRGSKAVLLRRLLAG